ncbi:MAG: VTT domain-containing protein [bacterium]|nr:VTT domain-containing protein [bacterium]
MLEILSAIIFIFLRMISVIFPPLPGFIFDLIGIAVFGKWIGFILGEIAIMLGACLAFFIARKYREWLIKKVTPLASFNKWIEKLSGKEQFFSLLVLRLSTNLFFDVINYAAGLTKIKFSKFFLASFLGTLPGMFLFYYFGGTAKQLGLGYFIGFIALSLLLAWLFVRKAGSGKIN